MGLAKTCSVKFLSSADIHTHKEYPFVFREIYFRKYTLRSEFFFPLMWVLYWLIVCDYCQSIDVGRTKKNVGRRSVCFMYVNATRVSVSVWYTVRMREDLFIR